jgi:transcriptional regulator with PAS, ATPase and Fis domain
MSLALGAATNMEGAAMSRGAIVVLSDSEPQSSAEPFVFVRDRDAACEYLARGESRAICLDRRDVEASLADARWLRRRRNRLPVVAIVEASEVARASEFLAAGVGEIVVRDESAPASVVPRVEALARRGASSGGPPDAERVIARSPAMRACLSLVEKAQQSDATVLLEGETGTGKEVIARAIHAGSRRARRAFVAINCAAFPETLLESELFGYERGAFTGADRARQGHFEAASGGTLFLDEIGETTPGFQVKLLRALQEGTVRPLGSTRETRVDVRVIAATNRNLAGEVESGAFRRDLYYRLHVFPIALPPLRARAEDLAGLAAAFLARRRGPGGPTRIAPDALRLLETYAWPGNVRELENEIARVCAHAAGEPEITAAMLSPEIRGMRPALPASGASELLRETMARFEAWVLARALERHAGRRVSTARALGITREALYKKLRRFGMQ